MAEETLEQKNARQAEVIRLLQDENQRLRTQVKDHDEREDLYERGFKAALDWLLREVKEDVCAKHIPDDPTWTGEYRNDLADMRRAYAELPK